MDPIMLVVIAAIALIAVIAVVVMTSSPQSGSAVSVKSCGEQTLSYVNENLATEGTAATLVSSEDQHGMFGYTVSYQGQSIPLYTTKDCTMLFMDPMEMMASQTNVAAAACAERALEYVNGNLVAPDTTASLTGIEEERGMYRLTVSYNELEFRLFATKDCNLLFMEGLDMTAAPPTPSPTPEPVKSDRPAVDLYVMSFCPYGTQAEATMQPVKDLLVKKADIQIHYITTVTGTNVTSIRSLHGTVEAEEDLRQICIQKYAPESLWTYLNRFNAECYPLTRNSTVMVRCSQNITSSLGLDGAKIGTCATGAEGIGLLATDEASAEKNGANASPTLLINGVEYSGARTPEAYKLAICGSFTTPPAECSAVLSSQQAAAAGSC
ncbi:MAG: DsbA family protein [Methanomicrobiales archaeon]|nr:DsbA family protein [Methanomicrobiales archaeon]MDD1653412.1 DsbA family protein [Methanomicrobiales archaeon]